MFVPGTVGRGSGVAEAVGVEVDVELGAGEAVGVIVAVGVGVDEAVEVVEAVGMVVSGAGVVVAFGAAVWLVGVSCAAPREAAPAVAGVPITSTSSSISLICTKNVSGMGTTGAAW